MRRTMKLTRGSDGQIVDLQIMPRLNFDARASFGEGGRRENAPMTIVLEGRVEPAAGETTAMPAWLRLWDFHETASDVRVATYLDSVLEREYKPEDFASGPKITGLRTINEDGQFGATVGFEMELTAERELVSDSDSGGGSGSPSSARIADVTRQYINDRLASIGWTLEAQGADAPAQLRAAAPDLPGLRVSEVRSLGENRFQIHFEWETWQDRARQIFAWIADVSITRPHRPKGYVPGAGPNGGPVSWTGQAHAGLAVVAGEIIGTDPVVLVEPPKLFREELFLPESSTSSVFGGNQTPLLNKHGFYVLRYTHQFMLLDEGDADDINVDALPQPISEDEDVADSEVAGF